jgi:hypothetical protein
MKPFHRILLVRFGLIAAVALAFPQTMFSYGVDGASSPSYIFWVAVYFVLVFPFWLPAVFPNRTLRRICGVLLLFPCLLGISVLLSQTSKLIKGYEMFSPFGFGIGVTVTAVCAISVVILFSSRSSTEQPVNAL